MFPSGFAALALLALCSCSSPPRDGSQSLDFHVPEHWAAQVQSQPEGEAVWRFSLEETALKFLVEEALANNQDLKAAAARLGRAEANSIIARAELFPTVDASFDATKRQQNFVGFPIPGGEDEVLTTRSRVLGVSLNSRWELDVWGRIRSARKAALAEYRSSQALLASARLSIAAQTIKAALAVMESQLQLDFERDTLESYRQTAEKVRSRYNLGLRSSSDLRLALNSVADAESRAHDRQIRLTRAKRQLEILLGRYPASAIELENGFPEFASDIPAGLPSDLLTRRPDLIAAENRLIAGRERVREAKASLFPRIALTASGGASGEDLKNLLDDTYSVWNLAANVVQPVFESGRLRAGVRGAKADYRERLAVYQQDVLNAFAEVENALNDEALLARMEESLLEAARQAKGAWELSEDRYVAGLSGIIAVLESKRRSVAADRAVIQVRRQRLDNRVDLHLALGGSFGAPVDPSSSNPELSMNDR